MEHWSHAQAIWDELGEERANDSGLKNICVIGVNTYGWTYAVRGMEPPGPMPYLKLRQNDELWTWGEKSTTDYIEGSAEEFCQVVTQCRNIKDTSLRVAGPVADSWMIRYVYVQLCICGYD